MERRPSLHEERAKRRRLDAVDISGGDSTALLLEAAANMTDGLTASNDSEIPSTHNHQRLLLAAADTSSTLAPAFSFGLQQRQLSQLQAACMRTDNDDLRLQTARLQVGIGSRAPSSAYASLLNGHGDTGPRITAAGLDSVYSATRAHRLITSMPLEEALLAAGGGAHLRNLNALTEQRVGAGASNAIRQLLEDRQRLQEQLLLRESDHDQVRRILGARPATSPWMSAVLARLQAERALLNQAAVGPSIVPSSHPLIASPRFSNGLTATGSHEVSDGRYQGVYNPAENLPIAGQSATAPASGGQSIHLYMSCDDDDLSPYQCLVRKQIELFEAQEDDAETNARGRNRPIVVGQVGIRCKHCKMLPPRKRARAAIYYPSKLDRLYQAGQTMASVHLGQHCQHIPAHIRQKLAELREGKSAALGGKKYWSDGARALGISQEDERLWFR